MTLDSRLGEIAGELSGLAVAVLRSGELSYEGYWGRRFIDPLGAADPAAGLPVDRETKFRVASISKTVTALGAMALVDRGLLDFGRDISDYLGFQLRNPSWPDRPITAAMLLSHTSSLRDGSGYSLGIGHRLEEFFVPGGSAYEGGAHFAAGLKPANDRGPGSYYAYANLGYGVLATAMERVSGERFDLYMKRVVLSPLGIDGSYNVRLLSDEGLGHLAALYRKGRDEDSWDPAGPWLPQVDDYRGIRPPAMPGLDTYEIGTNGSLFSPQGGLRVSAIDLTKVMRLLMGGGALGDTRIVSANAVSRMESLAWRYDRRKANGDIEDGSTRATGLGLVRTTGTVDAHGGDSLLAPGPSGEGRGPLMWGHHADAYGLLGGMLFEPETGFGLVYLIGGTPRDPARYRGSHYSRSRWEERIIEAIAQEL
jgi:CubicO group peptidase (beta-lactamase class C family)